jgi:hypothetical protein
VELVINVSIVNATNAVIVALIVVKGNLSYGEMIRYCFLIPHFDGQQLL